MREGARALLKTSACSTGLTCGATDSSHVAPVLTVHYPTSPCRNLLR